MVKSKGTHPDNKYPQCLPYVWRSHGRVNCIRVHCAASLTEIGKLSAAGVVDMKFGKQ
jgi:hypothetical protein